MTAKEKALDIIVRYFTLQETIEWGNDELKEETNFMYVENQFEYDSYYYKLAKASALMYVNDVLNILNPTSLEYKYFDEVELEIENYDTTGKNRT